MADHHWVKVTSTYTFDPRMAIATITRRDLLAANAEPANYRFLIDAPEFCEDFVRKILAMKYKGVANWGIEQLAWDIAAQRYRVLVTSPDFDPVPAGTVAPTLGPKHFLTQTEKQQ